MTAFHIGDDEDFRTMPIEIASAAVELRTGALAVRTQLIVYPPETGMIYWGTASVTAGTGAPLKAADPPLSFHLGDHLRIFAVSDGTNRIVRIVEIGTAAALPDPVSNLQAQNIKQNTMTLLWSAANNTLSYDIFKDGVFLDNTTSLFYNAASLSTNTTYRFSVKARNNSGNSPETFIDSTTLRAAEDALVFNADFTGRAGSKTNVIYDSVNNLECTLYGVDHNGSDGWLDNRGLFLNKQDYVSISSNTGILYDAMNLNTNGVTFEFVAYNVRGVLFRTDPANIISHVGPIVSASFYKYITPAGTEKPYDIVNTWFVNIASKLQASINNTLHNTNELNIVAVRFYPDGRCSMALNGNPALNNDKPADFADYANILATSKLFIRRDHVAINTDSTTIRSFAIYNRALSDDELMENYRYYKDGEMLRSVSVYPAEVQMDTGESQALLLATAPSRYAPLLQSKYTSGNPMVVSANQNGTLTGLTSGKTEVTVVSNYLDKEFINHVPVTVGFSTTPPPVSSRKLNGIAINRKTDRLEAGQSFALMATTLPFDVFNDNLVVWETSDPRICSVNLGVLIGISAGSAVITAYDSTRTYSEKFTVEIAEPAVQKIGEAGIYHVILEKYGIKADHSEAVNTTNGIRAALNEAAANHYKAVKFPYGRYLITPAAGTIVLPTEMTIDFSDSLISIELSAKTAEGYTMFLFDYVSRTKLINARIYGEADQTTLAASKEACVTVAIREAYQSGIENCTLSKSPGFNVLASLRLVKTGTLDRNVSMDNFEAGSIGPTGEKEEASIRNTFRSLSFLDIKGLGSYYSLGYTQGYQGYNYLRSRLYSIYFYDAGYQFIAAQKYNLQFYNYLKPDNASYAKIVIYQEEPPSKEDPDFKAVAFLRTCGMPRECFIRNCIIEDNFSCGLAMCGGEGWLLEGNAFSRNGKRMPACDIVWEDGWDSVVGDIVRNNSFNSKNGIIAAAGCSLTLYGNTFKQSTLAMWNRTQNFRIYNNFFNGRTDQQNITLSCQAESYFVRNLLSGITYTKAINHAGASYQIHDTGNTLINP